MKTRKLGKLEVSELGAGCMSISANYGPPADQAQGIEVIRTAHEKGVTFFDTAEVYGPYTNEELVGEALAPIRDKVVIATKFGFDIESRRRAQQPARAHQEGGRGARSSASGPTASISTTSTASIRRCRSKTWPARSRISSRQGKVLHFGLSEASAKTIRRAHAVQPVTAIQTEYSLMERDPEKNGVLRDVRGAGNRLRSVGSGRDGLPDREDRRAHEARPEDGSSIRVRPLHPREPRGEQADRRSAEASSPQRRTRRRLRSRSRGCWRRSRGSFRSPAHATSDHLNENLGAINVQLTPADLREIETAFSKLTVHGGRMNEDADEGRRPDRLNRRSWC